ncbi:MAG: cation:proton antiporter [Sulfolobaceae archaeon]|nr:cation:proton antiporter [Sulfolobaceae archaeon]
MNVIVISLLYIGIMLFLAKTFEEIFRRLNLVAFVGPIIIGIILRHFGIVSVNDIVSFITSLGIVFLLFLAGAEEFDIRSSSITLKDYITVIIQIIVPYVAITIILYYMHFTDFLLFAVPLAMTSAGPLTRLLMDTGLSNTEIGNAIFRQVIYVEIVFVILFALFENLSRFFITVVEVSLIIILILLIGRFVSKLLEKIEAYFKVREIEFASIVSLILIVSYIASIYMFNAAISAFFLGLLLRDYIHDRPEISERLHAFTYGFFEPLFFLGIGLYVSQIDITTFIFALLIFSILISSRFLSGYLASLVINVRSDVNAIGTSVKGGVDSSLLLSAFTLGYVTSKEYSIGILSISMVALVIPILFRRVYKGSEIISSKSKIKLSSTVKDIDIKPLYAKCNENLRSLINKIDERGARGIVIVDDNMRPLGYVSVATLLEIDPSKYEEMSACDVQIEEVPIDDENTKIIDILRRFRETESPVIAIVNSKGELITTIYERELLRYLVKV